MNRYYNDETAEAKWTILKNIFLYGSVLTIKWPTFYFITRIKYRVFSLIRVIRIKSCNHILLYYT
jgi:hypothetical protein